MSHKYDEPRAHVLGQRHAVFGCDELAVCPYAKQGAQNPIKYVSC